MSAAVARAEAPLAHLDEALAARLAAPNEHADGVFFDLDESAYHADTALGSTDMGRLYYSPADYWFSSRHNPLRDEETETEAQVRGSAVHAFVLYGREAFERRYAPAYLNGATKDGKLERERIAALGKTCLRGKDYERILQAGTMIRSNPHLAEAFSGGRSEVSIFWTRDGIRRKARLDYLKIRAVVDLKSITNTRRTDFVSACRNSIAQWNYPIQAAHYREAREALPALLGAGAVHGDHDPKWLASVAGQRQWGWCWIFWQAAGAPLTWATALSAGNPILDVARNMLAKAEENYRANVERFGLGSPWVVIEPVAELDMNELPAWWAR